MGRLKCWEVVPGHLVKHLFCENLKTLLDKAVLMQCKMSLPRQKEWIRSLMVPSCGPLPSVDRPSLFCGSVVQSCCSLCLCWANGCPGNQTTLAVWFWDFFNFCFNSMMSWKNLNCTKESFIGRLKLLVFQAWAPIRSANPELDMLNLVWKIRIESFSGVIWAVMKI